MASAPRTPARAIRAATVMALFASAADAAAEVGAHVGGQLVHTDNITLAPGDAAQAENVLDVTTGVAFERTQPRLDAHAAYDIEGVFYDDTSEANEVYHSLDAAATLALVLDRLYLDAFAIYDQTLSDANGKYSFNNISLTGNRTDVAIVGVSPFLLLNIGDNVTGELRYDYATFDYEDSVLQDSDQRFVSATLGNPGRRRGASWNVGYYNQHYGYGNVAYGDVEFEWLESQLGFWATPSVRLFTTQGLESDYRMVPLYTNPVPGSPPSVQPTAASPESPGLDEHYWYVGAEWRPSERQTVEFETGERSFGESNRFTWNRRSRGGGITVSYDEGPSGFLEDQLSSARSAGELAPIDTLSGPNGNPFYLQKIWNVMFVLEGNRTTSGVRFFDEERFDIARMVENNEDEVQTESYRGTELTFAFDLSSRGHITASAQIAERRSLITLTNDDFEYLSIAWTRDLGRATQLELWGSREASEPQLGGPGFDYEANQIHVSLSRSFGAVSGERVPRRYSGFLDASQRY